MVGAAAALTLVTCLGALAAAPCGAQRYVAIGQCRAGVAQGSYQLRMPDGRLLVSGAFAQGHMTGTFIFWTRGGARLAVLPLDNDARNGTLARWYAAPDAARESGRELEAPYVGDRLQGVKRTWYLGGAPRSEYRYLRGALLMASAWSESGAALPEAEARRLAASDAEADDRGYAGLVALVRDHPPSCAGEPAP